MLFPFFSKVLNWKCLVYLGAISIILFKLLLLIISLKTGFEIGDEGCFLLALKQPQGVYNELHLQHQALIKPVFSFIKINVFNVRILTLLLELVASFLLATAVIKQLNFQQPLSSGLNRIAVLFFVIIGINNGVTSNSVYYLQISNHIGYLIIAGFIFCRLLKNPSTSVLSNSIVFAIGILTGLWWFVKFSSAGIAALFICIYILNQRDRWVKLSIYTMGIIALAGMYFLIFTPPLLYIEMLRQGFYMIGLQGYNSIDILRGYWAFDVPCFVFFISIGFLPFIVIQNFTQRPEISFWAGMVVLVGGILFTENIYAFNFFPGYHLKIVHVLLYVFGILFYLHTFQSGRRDLWLLWFLIIPFAAAFGTAIPLQMSTMSYSLPIVAGIGLLILLSGLSLRFKVGLSAVVTTLLLSQYIYVQFFLNRLPNGFQGNITKQTEHIKSEGIYVSKEVKTFITVLRNLLNKADYSEADPIVALTDMPGVVYLLSGTSPSTHWYFSKNTTRVPDAAKNLDCYHLSRVDYSKKNYLLILENTDPAILNCVQGYPKNYTNIGKEFSPYHKQYVTVWVSNNK